jgi:5-methylcytosine-specific restriction endonuclease McrA
MIIIKSSKESKSKFTAKISYEKAIIHLKEGSARILDQHTIIKIMSRRQMKKYILERDNYICHYCGEYGDTVDHKIPRSKGGCSTPKNLVCCCHECNQRKLTMDYNDFYLHCKQEGRWDNV